MNKVTIYYSIDYVGSGESQIIPFTSKEVRDKHVKRKLEIDYDSVYGEGDFESFTESDIAKSGFLNNIEYPKMWEEDNE